MSMAALKNPKHDAFAREIAGGNSFACAWTAVGYNENSNNAARLARQPKIVARVAELRDEFNAAAGLHLRYLQEKLLPLASSDATRYFEAITGGGLKLKDFTVLPAELRVAIAEVAIDDKGKIKFKLHDKLRAIDSLIKTIGGYAPDKIELTQNGAAIGFAEMQSLDVVRRVAFFAASAMIHLEAGGYVEDLARLAQGLREAASRYQSSNEFAGLTPEETAQVLIRDFMRRFGPVTSIVCDPKAAAFLVDVFRQLAGGIERDAARAIEGGTAEGGQVP
jgi:phage terminase small subunit